MTFDAFFQSVCEYMDRSAEIQNRLKEILNGKPRCSQATTVAASQEARRQIFNTRLSMARLCGMADGWFGAPSGCSDVAKFLLCEEHFRWRWSAAGVSFDETLTGLQRRVALIERLRKTRPVLGSTLESIVRIAGSVAKRADLTARKASSIN